MLNQFSWLQLLLCKCGKWKSHNIMLQCCSAAYHSTGSTDAWAMPLSRLSAKALLLHNDLPGRKVSTLEKRGKTKGSPAKQNSQSPKLAEPKVLQLDP